MVDTILNINCIYKDYGRSRGSEESAKYFKERIKKILMDPKFVYKNYLKMNITTFPEIFDIKKLELIKLLDSYQILELEVKKLVRYKKRLREKKIKLQVNLLTPDEINISLKSLFSFCMIQTPSHYGRYQLIKRKNDIVFGKGIDEEENTYLQCWHSANVLDKPFFPKYYIPINMLDKKRLREKKEEQKKRSKLYKDGFVSSLNIGYYNRSDTCPNQTQKYNKCIEDLRIKYPGIYLNIIQFGTGNDLKDDNLINTLNKIDIMLYTDPDKLDPYPNTILHSIAMGCYIYHIDRYDNPSGQFDALSTNVANGIFELYNLFKDSFIEDLLEIFEKKQTSKNITKEIGNVYNNVNGLLSLTDLHIFYKLKSALKNYFIDLEKDVK
jgi:hypothetical protein